jgi:hypothetical protein
VMQRSKFAVCALAALIGWQWPARVNQPHRPHLRAPRPRPRTRIQGVTLKVNAPVADGPGQRSTLGDGVVPTLTATAGAGTYSRRRSRTVFSSSMTPARSSKTS